MLNDQRAQTDWCCLCLLYTLQPAFLPVPCFLFTFAFYSSSVFCHSSLRRLHDTLLFTVCREALEFVSFLRATLEVRMDDVRFVKWYSQLIVENLKKIMNNCQYLSKQCLVYKWVVIRIVRYPLD